MQRGKKWKHLAQSFPRSFTPTFVLFFLTFVLDSGQEAEQIEEGLAPPSDYVLLRGLKCEDTLRL